MKLRVQSSGFLALGIFYLRTGTRQRAVHRLRVWAVVCAVCLLSGGLLSTIGLADEPHVSTMKRRQQGILTGMPFMAHVSQRSFVDDLGRRLYLARPPARVISLAPSVTEILFALGAGEQVVGVTEFCDYPLQAQAKPKVGYARPNLESVVALMPDIILVPRDFLEPAFLGKLEELNINVFVLQATTIEGVAAQVTTIGRMLDRVAQANDLVGVIRERLVRIKARTGELPKRRVLYVLNSEPLITVGPGSFIHHMLEVAGGANVAAESGAAYPRLSVEAVLKQDPEVLLFPAGGGESIPEMEQQLWQRWTTMSAVKDRRFATVPTDLVNRPGPRIVDGLEALARAIHPEAFRAADGQ